MSYFDDNEAMLTGVARDFNTVMSYDFIWETKGGQQLTHGEMETSHLLNCIKVLERRGKGESLHANAMRYEIKSREAKDV